LCSACFLSRELQPVFPSAAKPRGPENPRSIRFITSNRVSIEAHQQGSGAASGPHSYPIHARHRLDRGEVTLIPTAESERGERDPTKRSISGIAGIEGTRGDYTFVQTKPTPAEKAKGGPIEAVSQPQVRTDEAAGVGNIEKVRDILFGSQMRDYEKRFARMEERLAKEIANLREETGKRFDAIESYAKREVESLSDRLSTEQNERTESLKREAESLSERLKVEQTERAEVLKELSKELKEANRLLEKRIAQLDDLLGKTSRELRQQLLDQSKELSDVIRLKYEDAMAGLERVGRELRLDKVDRSKLSELLMGMALQLTDDAALRFNLEADNALHE